MQLNKRTLTASAIGAGATLLVALTVSLAPNGAAATTTLTPVADTYVDNGSPATNFGTSSQLVVDNSPVRRSFIKFNVTGLSGAVTNAKLRIRTINGNNGSANGGTWKSMTNTSWSESAVTWNNQPAIDGATLGTLGSVVKSTWYEIDVTSAVTGNGAYSFGGTSPNNDGAYYSSRESGANAPQLVITTSGGATPTPTPGGTPTPTPAPGDPVFVGAGDISNSGTGDSQTAALLANIPGTVFTAGDNVYDSGTTTEFNTYYDPTWGAFLSRTRPAPGNHDYNTSGATGYYNYFGAQAGPSGRGYYSYDLGNWHIVSLNSEVAMSVGSAQEQWLRNDLAASSAPCTLAYWHQPRWTSGANHAPNPATGPLVQALYDFNADVIVTGHNHQYERFAPMNPSGAADNVRGIREFVAGMGGASHYSFGTIQPNSEARNSTDYGVLKFTLHANSYDWQFVPVAGASYNDSGTTSCH